MMSDDEKATYRPEGISDALVEQGGPQDHSTESNKPVDVPGGPRGADRPVVASIGFVGLLRFAWRQLTSMRVALLLLMLLAVVAIPGSMLPQKDADPQRYQQYLLDHGSAAQWLDRFQFFEVYTSVWFSAIYILLFVSLVGCILPRTRVHLRALRAAPPRAPRNFARMPAKGSRNLGERNLSAGNPTAEADAPPGSSDAFDRAAAYLRRRILWWPTYRVVESEEPDGSRTLSAERGYLRESGNLVFHLALVGLLISIATGQLLHYRGQALVVEGRGFANAEMNYDSFEHGAWFKSDSLIPFSMRLDSFDAVFRLSDAQARDFTANVTLNPDGVAAEDALGVTNATDTIKVNHPLQVGGAKMYLQGNGYAPRVTVTDSDGQTAFAGSVPFISQDNVYTSQGTIKVPDVTSGEQFGFVGYFLPTAEQLPMGWRSIYPQPMNPVLVLTAWKGDLGLDNGIPQNVYQLKTDKMTQLLDDDGQPLTITLKPGETAKLPGDLGSITFDAVDRFAAFDLRHDPALPFVLIFALLGLAGLTGSLFVPRRRVWVRLSGSTIEAAGLARSEDTRLQGVVDELLDHAAGTQTPSSDKNHIR